MTDLYKCMKNETMHVHVCEIYGTRCEILNTTQFSPNYISFMNNESKFFLSV